MGIRIFGTSENFYSSLCTLANVFYIILIIIYRSFWQADSVLGPDAYSAISVMVNRSWLFHEFICCVRVLFVGSLQFVPLYDKKVKKPGIRFLYPSFFACFHMQTLQMKFIFVNQSGMIFWMFYDICKWMYERVFLFTKLESIAIWRSIF